MICEQIDKKNEKVLNNFTESILNYQEFYINILKQLLQINKQLSDLLNMNFLTFFQGIYAKSLFNNKTYLTSFKHKE